MKRSLLPALLVLVGGCGILDPGAKGDLEDAMDRWEAQRIASYEYRVTQTCFCPTEHTRPYLIRVTNGVVTEMRDAETGGAAPTGLQRRSVPDLFDVIADALDRDADDLQVEYDPQLGYPTRINIDYMTDAIDEELRLEATGLVAR